uniref:RRM domain-containing protein n=1 Tax=Balaenoptera musculus TaxID=9771 RepID=A0A8C0CWC5_BALMU
QCASFTSFLHSNFSGTMETNTPHLDDAGPVIKVKIPKDKDGKPKQFAFVNFKREVSVPYAMNLLNGIKLFGRPIKIQFRSGSSHASQEVSLSYPQHHVGSSSPTSTSPTVMNSALRQMSYGGKFGSPHLDQSGFSPSVQSHNHAFNQSSTSQWRQDTPLSQRKVRILIPT